MPSQTYLPAIDTLRALSVIAVILFHYGGAIAPAGYLGVDAFFVISGFVITLSLKNLDHSSVSVFLGSFYARRVRRIVPALVFCVVISSVLLILLTSRPVDSVFTGGLSLLGLSNIYLYLQSADYFSLAAELNAFTHTWSLGVEEQFYLLFPTILYVTGFSKLGQKGGNHTPIFLVLCFLTAFSLGSYALQLQNNASGAFYLMHSRFWQLSFGALAFLASDRFHLTNILAGLEATLARFCFVFILLLIAFGDTAPFVASLLICLSIAVLLVIIHGSGCDYFPFNNRPFQSLGLVSYSLYLWHWPLLVLAKLTVGDFWVAKVVCLGLTVVLSIISYRFVEKPIRRWPLVISNSNLLFRSILFLCALGVMLTLIAPRYFVSYNSIVADYFDVSPVAGKLEIRCHGAVLTKRFADPYQSCLGREVSSEKTRSIYLLGDSHAAQFVSMMESALDGSEFALRFVNTEKRTDAHWAWINDTPAGALDLEFVLDNAKRGDFLALAFHRGHLNRARDVHLSLRQEVKPNTNSKNFTKNARDYIARLKQRGVDVLLIKDSPLMASITPSDTCALQIRLVGKSVCRVSKVQDLHTRKRQELAIDSLSAEFDNVYVWDVLNEVYGENQHLDVLDDAGQYTMRDWNHLSEQATHELSSSFLRPILK